MQETDGSTRESDAELLRRARSGDSGAFRILVERYEPLVAGTVIGMLGRGPEAEEAGQETFVRFWKALDKFRGDAALGTYLTRIAMNVTLNQIRKRTRWYQRFGSPLSDEQADPDPGPDSLATQRDRSEHVQRAIRRLRPEFRSVVVLRHIQGLSTAETAAALDIPVGTVLSRLSRAQTLLRENLASLL